MGISLDRDARIAGYRQTTFKNALLGFMRTQLPERFIDLKSIFPMRRDGAIVFEECLDRGFINRETLKITENGEAIARAKAQRRTPIAKAKALLQDFIKRVDDLNHNPKYVHYVNQVWLFGSLMREEATVGDIDLAIETERRPEYAADYTALENRLQELADGYSGYPWLLEGWILDRMLFGSHRHPLLAGVQKDTGDLASLAAPCRLIYDRERGGKVDEPILPCHPKSSGHVDGLTPPTEVPDLTPAPIRPMDAQWIAGFDGYGIVSPAHIFRGWTDDAHKLFPHYPRGLRVVGDNHRLGNDFWIPERLGQKGLDARSAVALINATHQWGTCIILNRIIETDQDVWTLKARFTHLELLRNRKRPEVSSLPDIVAASALIIAVDAERMLRRAAELPICPIIQINLRPDVDDTALNQFFYEPVQRLLRQQAIRIAPSDCECPNAVILS
jgi:predicted nucleotidyltransferase